MKNIKAQLEFFGRFLMVVVGAFVYAIAMNFFIQPAGVFSGGTTGISQIINHVLFNGDANLGLILLVVNLPFMLLGVWKLKSEVVLKTIIFIVSSSIFITILPTQQIVTDPMLAVIFGGLTIGAGLGISLRNGGATGGVDIVSLVIIERNPNATVGKINLTTNIVIFAILGVLISVEVAMLSIINSFFATFAIDKINTYTQKLSVNIKTTVKQEVIDMINLDLHRGSSYHEVIGGFSGQPMYEFNTIISQHQVHVLNAKMQIIDPKAFIVITRVAQIHGNFNPAKY